MGGAAPLDVYRLVRLADRGLPFYAVAEPQVNNVLTADVVELVSLQEIVVT